MTITTDQDKFNRNYEHDNRILGNYNDYSQEYMDERQSNYNQMVFCTIL